MFIESFNSLENPRVEHTKKHLLLDIIALSLMATMSGAQCYTEIELFGEIHNDWLMLKYWAAPQGLANLIDKN
jgi:hypothetical protein